MIYGLPLWLLSGLQDYIWPCDCNTLLFQAIFTKSHTLLLWNKIAVVMVAQWLYSILWHKNSHTLFMQAKLIKALCDWLRWLRLNSSHKKLPTPNLLFIYSKKLMWFDLEGFKNESVHIYIYSFIKNFCAFGSLMIVIIIWELSISAM